MKISLRNLLSRLTALAITTTAISPVAADPDVDDHARNSNSNSRALGEDDDDDCELAGDLPIDREHIDAPDAAIALGRGLAMALGSIRPLAATHLVSTWALSEDSVRRLAVANALEWTFRLVGDDMVLDHLSRDPDPAIRAATARAAWARRVTGGDPGVLERLVDDPDPEVRAVARRAG